MNKKEMENKWLINTIMFFDQIEHLQHSLNCYNIEYDQMQITMKHQQRWKKQEQISC